MSDIPQQIGPYKVDREIGRGGMGVVYLAHDMNLDRAVAIKTLPAEVTGDPERLGRFEREARLLATLNHANIAGVYGLEKLDGARYLVLEYVAGETLSERLAAGPLPMDEALPIALQITEAVESAHEGNVVHRDLKPANIKFTADGRVKVLDFGLAKALGETPSTSADTLAGAVTATLQDSPTMPGMILGTAGYMSPEQARGKDVDKRSDIWSFGCILYEMLSGATTFPGETIADSIGATLHKDPEWAALPPDTPPVVQLLLRRCLRKDRRRRLQDIGDARVEIEEAIADPTASSVSLAGAALSIAAPRKRGWRDAIPWIFAAVAGVAFAIVMVALWFATRSPALAPVRVSVEVSRDKPLYMEIGAQAALSPDGTMLAYVATEGPTRHLYLRRLDQLEGAPLSGTAGARHPFFSPDGQWLGFFTAHNLRKVSVHGGAPLTLAKVENDRGGTWYGDDSIVFTTDVYTGLSLIPASGGTPVTLTTPDRDLDERSHRWPSALPGDRGVLFVSQLRNTNFDDTIIEVLDPGTGRRKVLHHGGTSPRYAPSGHLLYVHKGTLFAAPLDLDRLELTGPSGPVIEGIVSSAFNGGANYAVSNAGTLAYQPGSSAGLRTAVLSVDRDGSSTVLLDEETTYESPSLSPTGDRLALMIATEDNFDIWVYEFERENLLRLTVHEAADMAPLWTPDGSRILFSSDRDSAAPNLYWRLADGSGPVERLTTSDNPQFASCISPDGSLVVFDETHDINHWDLWTLSLDGESTPEPWLRTSFHEAAGYLSPDGRWLAYNSNESGEFQVYVRPFPDTGGRWLVSTDGGELPRWGPMGDEIFYNRRGTLMVAKVSTEGPTFRTDRPEVLIDEHFIFPNFYMPYDVFDDGLRFILTTEHSGQNVARTQITLVFNWFEELKQRVPTN